jgi:hypothetical protein
VVENELTKVAVYQELQKVLPADAIGCSRSGIENHAAKVEVAVRGS